MDAIVMKAMRKEPADRYPSVRELAQDIERYLSSRPVQARRGTRRYVALKFIRRHRVGAGIAAVAALVLGGSVAVVVRASHIANQERDRAQRRFSEVRRLAHSVIFDLDDKIYTLPGSIPVRRDLIATAIVYVDGLAKEVSGDLGLQRELAESYLRIGNVQGNPNMDNLGDGAGALKSFQKAGSIARHLAAVQPSFESRNLLAKILQSEGGVYLNAKEMPKAEACWKESIGIARDLQKRYPASWDAKYLLATSLDKMAGLSSDTRSLEYRMESMRLFEDFLAAFDDADTLFLTEIYAAGEDPIEGVSGTALAQALKVRGHVDVRFVARRDELPARIAAEARPGDVVLMLGAGDIVRLGDDLLAALAAQDTLPSVRVVK
jgi:tetratricopeptide (TPR) repeat protein